MSQNTRATLLTTTGIWQKKTIKRDNYRQHYIHTQTNKIREISKKSVRKLPKKERKQKD